MPSIALLFIEHSLPDYLSLNSSGKHPLILVSCVPLTYTLAISHGRAGLPCLPSYLPFC